MMRFPRVLLLEERYQTPIWELLIRLYGTHGSLAKVAKELEISRPTLQRWLESLGKSAMDLRSQVPIARPNKEARKIRTIGASRVGMPLSLRIIKTLQQKIQDFLALRGYDSVSTPTLEQTELFLRKSGGELASRMYSFTDLVGRQVSLRPEFTSSVVRSYIDGSLKGQLPIRWQYSGTVYRYLPGNDEATEFTQSGAELIGPPGPMADAEVISMAAQSLDVVGLRGYRIRIGHLGVVGNVLEALGLSERGRLFLLGSLPELRKASDGLDQVREQAKQLGLLQSKTTPRMSHLMKQLDLTDAREIVEGFLGGAINGPTGQRTQEEVMIRYLRKLREHENPEAMEKGLDFCASLAKISGSPATVIKELDSLLKSFRLNSSLIRPITELFEALAPYDLGKSQILLELGMARGFAYYTGTIFEIDIPGAGDISIGGGGRYDGLVRALGGSQDIPALGFAFSLDQIAKYGSGSTTASQPSCADVLVVTENGSNAGVRLAEQFRSTGVSVEINFSPKTDREIKLYANRKGIKRIMKVSSDGNVQQI